MPKAASSGTRRSFDPRLLLDIAVRVALGLFFAFSAGVYAHNALVEMRRTGMHLDAPSIGRALSVLATALYTLLIACLYVLRLRPVNKFAGLWPSVAAILGGFLMFGVILFKPRTDLPLAAQMTASIMALAGNLLAAYILSRLGRSFSILPESRKLVTTGPYAYVRHPLYLAEALATFGTMILFLSPGAVALVVAQTLLQLVRIHYEERVLAENFPEYKDYAARTARLIPGLY